MSVTYREAINRALTDAMREDADVFVLGEDVGAAGGPLKVTEGMFEEFGARRVVDTPISEQAIIGTAIGAAVSGLRPVAEIMFADFAGVCFDGIANEMAKYRYMTGGQVTMPVTVRLGNGAGAGFGAQHSQTVENWFLNVPGLKLVTPATPADAYALLRAAIRDDDPVLFFEHKKMYRSVRGNVPDGEFSVPLGKAQVTHPGTQVTVIAYGLMAHYALEAADRVAEEGISVEVVDLRTLRPLDKETVLDSVRKTGKCVIVYEDNRFGGYGAEVAAIVAEEAFDYLDGPVTRIAGPDVPGVPYNHVLEEWFMVSPEKIADGIRKLAAY